MQERGFEPKQDQNNLIFYNPGPQNSPGYIPLLYTHFLLILDNILPSVLELTYKPKIVLYDLAGES